MSNLFAPEPQSIIIDDPAAVAAFVQSHLHVTVAQLFQALDVGMAEAAVTTDHSSAGAFGTRLWDGSLTSLRDQFAPAGWTVHRPGGLEVVRRPDKAVQITPSLGTENVGVITGVSPKWARKRGVSTKKAIDENQMSLADLAPGEPAFRPIQTWWLMYHPFLAHGEKVLRAEISLPIEMSAKGVVLWAYRVFLGERTFGDSTIADIPVGAPDPEVTIRRRATVA